MQRVAIYTRISSDRPDEAKEPGLGVARQEEDCRRLAASKGLEVVRVIVDNNKSAYRRNKLREGWEEVKALVDAGSIDGIVAWHTDRLYRHPMDLEEIIKLVEEKDLIIYTVTAGEIDLSTSGGRGIARVHGAMSRNEVEQKAERQSRKMLQSAIDGKYSGGRVPLGYEIHKTVAADKGRLFIKEPEATVLRESARRLLRGHSLVGTASWVATELQRPIRPVTLKKSLTSYLIAGYREHVPQKDRDKWNAKRKEGKVSGEPKGTVYPASWEPILDHETWEAIRALLLDPARKSQGRRPVKSLLSGIIRCGACGKVMNYSAASYKCSFSNGCGKVGISTPAVERTVAATVRYRIEHSQILTAIQAPLPLSDVQQKRKALEDKRETILSFFKQDLITRENVETQLRAIKETLANLEQDAADNLRERTANIEVLKGADRWDELELDEKRLIIRRLVQKVTIQPTVDGRKSGSTFDPHRVQILFIDGQEGATERPERPMANAQDRK